ncbi:unnamed protein product [Lota lota]
MRRSAKIHVATQRPVYTALRPAANLLPEVSNAPPVSVKEVRLNENGGAEEKRYVRVEDASSASGVQVNGIAAEVSVSLTFPTFNDGAKQPHRIHTELTFLSLHITLVLQQALQNRADVGLMPGEISREYKDVVNVDEEVEKVSKNVIHQGLRNSGGQGSSEGHAVRAGPERCGRLDDGLRLDNKMRSKYPDDFPQWQARVHPLTVPAKVVAEVLTYKTGSGV